MTKKDIIDLVEGDKWMMDTLKIARALDLPDWMIGAGFVRNKVWDFLHGYTKRTLYPDIDLIYFDKNDLACSSPYVETTEIEEKLQKQLPDVGIPWSVTNQARMHTLKHFRPYISSEDALSYWLETATCVAIRLEKDDSLTLITPLGIEDLVNLEIKPNPNYISYRKQIGLQAYKERVRNKHWEQKWPRLKLFNMS